MANKIILKRSSVSGKVPQPSDLDYGEVALNYTDELLYFKNSSNQIKSFSTSTTGGGGNSGPTEMTVNTTGTSQQSIDSFAVDVYRSAEYQMTISSPDGFCAFKLLVLHDGSASYDTQYAVLGSSLGVITSDINSGNVRILFTPTSTETEVKMIRQLITNSNTYGASQQTIPEDLSSGSGIIDLMTGSSVIDLNVQSGGTQLPSDLGSGSGSIDLTSGTGIVDLNQ